MTTFLELFIKPKVTLGISADDTNNIKKNISSIVKRAPNNRALLI